MTDRLTGTSLGIEVKIGKVVPLCPNSAPGEGNCFGMVKYGTCPKIRGGKGKFAGCTQYIKNLVSECDNCS